MFCRRIVHSVLCCRGACEFLTSHEQLYLVAWNIIVLTLIVVVGLFTVEWCSVVLLDDGHLFTPNKGVVLPFRSGSLSSSISLHRTATFKQMWYQPHPHRFITLNKSYYQEWNLRIKVLQIAERYRPIIGAAFIIYITWHMYCIHLTNKYCTARLHLCNAPLSTDSCSHVVHNPNKTFN